MAEINFSNLKDLPMSGRKALTPVRLTSDGANETLWAGRDGSLVTLPWKQALVLEGRCFMFTVGTLSTAITGGGNGTILDLDQPEALISVPAGTAIMPLCVAVQTNCPAAITDNDITQILLCLDKDYKWNADGTSTTETALNMRTDMPRASACACQSAFTADMLSSSGSDTTHHMDLCRVETKAEVAANGSVIADAKMLYAPEPAPIIVRS